MCLTCHLARNVGPLLGVDEPVHGGRVLPNQPLVSISEYKNGTSENHKKRKMIKIPCTVCRYGSGYNFFEFISYHFEKKYTVHAKLKYTVVQDLSFNMVQNTHIHRKYLFESS
jgi:hypothetical protein